MSIGASDGKPWNPVLPEGLATSRLMAAGGYLLLPTLIGPQWLEGLADEAERARAAGSRAEVAVSDETETRGGSPARAFRGAPGGEIHWSLHGSPDIARTLSVICELPLIATGGGTYSYYEREGDFLALHRDVISCDVAMITCIGLREPKQPAGGLLLYPQRIRDQLSDVRSGGPGAGTPVRLAPGETILLLGGLVPHEVTPTVAGQDRVVAINCFRLEGIEVE
jgi:hypothetical protein